jgi:hypothetical protein
MKKRGNRARERREPQEAVCTSTFTSFCFCLFTILFAEGFRDPFIPLLLGEGMEG